MKNFIRNDAIDRRAEDVIAMYERKMHVTVKPPVPIEEIIMQIFELTVDWDEFKEVDGVRILGGLKPEAKTIVLNLSQRELFDSTPGLERSTIGHEAGHWEYDIDKGSIGQPQLFSSPSTTPYLRSVTKKYGPISVFRGNMWTPDTDRSVATDKMLDTPEQCRVVNRFAAALSMPRYLMKEVVKGADVLSWPGLYSIQKILAVSITALNIRLEQLTCPRFMYQLES